jgi:hypothetical protein
MTSSARIYSVALALLVFFLTWAAVAAKPWIGSAASGVPDARVAELVAREDQLQARGAEVQRILDERWATYDSQLSLRNEEIAAARKSNKTDVRQAAKAQKKLDRQAAVAQASAPPPQVEVITLPPLTQTRSS